MCRLFLAHKMEEVICEESVDRLYASVHANPLKKHGKTLTKVETMRRKLLPCYSDQFYNILFGFESNLCDETLFVD